MFIVFEGGDGSGKSTQARALYRRLQRRGYPAILTREPGGTALGERLRRQLKGQQGINPLAELFLFNAARAQLVATVIQPALVQGKTVICDRFTASTVAYQGFGRGLSLELVQTLNQAATGGLVPDLIILLDLPVEVGLARRGALVADTFDGAPLEFHRKVREGYLVQAKKEASRWLALDATRDRGSLGREIWGKAQPLLR